MVNRKKVTGQTIAIIILAILLSLSLVFGGVFAFYTIRTNQVTGRILMANLKINMTASTDGITEKSELVISYGTNVIPNQLLGNSPLTISNYSSVPIYLILVYDLTAEKNNGNPVADTHVRPVIDFGYDYINPDHPEQNTPTSKLKNSSWIDYVYTSNLSGESKTYRCLVGMDIYQSAHEEASLITVVKENSMRLSEYMGNEYQSTAISMTFQAYAVAADSFSFTTEQVANKQYKCEKIVESIYTYAEYSFMNN